MKIALFNRFSETANEERQEKAGADRFERFLVRACLAFFIILVFAQAALTNPVVRLYLFHDYLEGEPLGSEKTLYTACKMELSLIDRNYCSDLKILVNGDERDSFKERSVMLNVKEGDIVELYGSNLSGTARVGVTAASEKIAGMLGKTVIVTDGITHVARIVSDP